MHEVLAEKNLSVDNRKGNIIRYKINNLALVLIFMLFAYFTRERSLKTLTAFSTPANDQAHAVLVSVGTESRPGPQKAQRETLGGWVRLVEYTEVNTPPCVVCNSTQGVQHPTRRAAKGMSRDWWCAQKRHILALYETLKKMGVKDLPRVVILIDDDAFVNPLNLRRWVEEKPTSYWETPRYLGHRALRYGLIRGGAGMVMSRGTLKAFFGSEGDLEPLRWCVEQAQGGDWCNWHADWGVNECFLNLTGGETEQARDKFTQDYNYCTKEHITCHGRKTYEDWMETWATFVKPHLSNYTHSGKS